MNTFNSFVEQINAYRNQVGISSQIAIGSAVILCIAAIVGVGIWSSQPHYVPFLQDVPAVEMAQVVAKLDTANIKYKLSFSGNDILVDKSKWNRANLAAGDLAPGKLVDPEWKGDILEPSERSDFRQLLFKEKRLAANLTQLEGIEYANVHLSIADASPFARERQKSTASVILTLRPGYTLSRQTSQGIISFVASADKSLEAENVQLLDEKGNIYTHRGSENGGFAGDNYEMQRQLESDKSFAAQSLLERILGQGKAVVTVSAELNHEKNTLKTESFDTDSQAIVSETIDKESTQDPERLPLGTAGTSGNFSAKAFSQSKQKQILHESESKNTQYINGKRSSVTEFLPGEISRLTVAVTFDPWVKKKLATTKDVAVAAQAAGEKSVSNGNEFEELPIKDQQIEEIVKQAIGFDANRGDEITVVRAKLAESEFAELLKEVPAGFLDTYANLARHVSLGVAAILAFLFGTMTLRKLRPLTVVKESESQITPQRASQLSAMSTLAHQHPEVLGKIMAAWMNESVETKTTARKTGKKAA